ncbi:MAG: sigma-70 family RNA polymerase sigma factor [Bacteroidales bacterium]|jgi:RNA polymerase sigma-70 factor (ECF subfamily)|nr:sigma-70 family RNA polymerase sigma factor [Bacteroidales bacterium]
MSDNIKQGQQPDDEYILTLFAQEKSKEQAFGLLMQKYRKDVYYAVRRMVYLHADADDVTQNVWLKVWRYLAGFRRDSNLKTWIHKICINESLTFINNKKKIANPSNEEDYMLTLLSSAAEERYYSPDQMQRLLAEAVARLPEKQRIVFNLRYYDEMPYEEMSKMLNTSVGALKASYHIAAKKVEEFLVKH